MKSNIIEKLIVKYLESSDINNDEINKNNLIEGTESKFLELGKNYLIRTVTMIYTGKIKEIGKDVILLEKASWIADTGRWTDNLISCEFEEVEPYKNEVLIYKGAFLDITEIDKLPLEQK